MADTTARDLRSAEDELERLRTLLALTVGFIHDTAYDYAARAALAERLRLPAPRATAPKETADVR
jgi:Ni,Fe-hydrogenase III large subunit